MSEISRMSGKNRTGRTKRSGRVKKLVGLVMGAVMCISLFGIAAMAGCASGDETKTNEPYYDGNYDEYEQYYSTLDWSVYDVQDESVAYYNAVIYSYKRDWIKTDFLLDDANIIRTNYPSRAWLDGETEEFDGMTYYTDVPDSRTYVIADQETMDGIFKEEAIEEVNADFDSQIVVLYLFGPGNSRGYYITDIAADSGTDTTTIYARTKHINPLIADASEPAISALVVVMDNPGTGSVEFVETAATQVYPELP